MANIRRAYPVSSAVGVTTALQRVGRWLGQCHARWRQRQQLALLDDRTLFDLGLTHAEIRREVRRPFWD